MRCPICGKESTFTHHVGLTIGGEWDERWSEVWYTCDTCGGKLSVEEKEVLNGTEFREKKSGNN